MKFLITAGGTREYIDPVRFLSNASSGKMGYALAASASKHGHEVTLISANVTLPLPENPTVVKADSRVGLAPPTGGRGACEIRWLYKTPAADPAKGRNGPPADCDGRRGAAAGHVGECERIGSHGGTKPRSENQPPSRPTFVALWLCVRSRRNRFTPHESRLTNSPLSFLRCSPTDPDAPLMPPCYCPPMGHVATSRKVGSSPTVRGSGVDHLTGVSMAAHCGR